MQEETYVYRLRSCVWEITLACCFSCRYCGSKAGKARENELTTKECLSVAAQLSEMGCQRVSLIGGEVFMRPDWDVITKALTDQGIRVSIITNGFLFSESLISRLKEINIESVAISLDGPEKIHDSFRQTGSFQRALEAMDILSANSIPVSVITTLHDRNMPSLGELFELLRDKKIFAWQLQACSPMGNASKGDFSADIDFGTVIRFVEEHKQEVPFALGIADNVGYYTPAEGELRGSKNYCFSGCRAGLTGIGIDSIGNVRGCESMYDDVFIEGNLRKKTLREIWEAPDAFSYNRQFTPDKLTGKCAKCAHKLQCAGGCRSYNYFSHGKLYESPRCAKRDRNEKT